MSGIEKDSSAPKPLTWRGQLAQFAAIVAVVFLAKGAVG